MRYWVSTGGGGDIAAEMTRSGGPTRLQQTEKQKQQQQSPMSPARLQDKCHIPLPSPKTTCLLCNFVKVTAARAERLAAGLGCVRGAFAAECTPEMSSQADRGVRRVMFAFHQIFFSFFVSALSFIPASLSPSLPLSLSPSLLSFHLPLWFPPRGQKTVH